MRRTRPATLLLLAACASTPAPEDADSDVIVDSEDDAVESDAPVDDASDTTVDTDVEVDTEPPLDPWTGGLVDLSEPLLGPDALVPFPGTPNAPGGPGPQPLAISFGDLDEDGTTEVVVGATVYATSGVVGHQVLRWDGSGLVPAPDIGIPTLRSGVIGIIDLDGDGHLDLLSNDLATMVAFGRGDGTFEDPLALEPDFLDFFGSQIGVWDMDADGWLDLVLTGDCTAGLRYALREGPRSWRVVSTRTVERTPAVMGSSLLVVPDPGGDLVYTAGNACDFTRPHPGWYRVERQDVADPLLRAVVVPIANPPWVTIPGVDQAIYPTQLMPMGATLTDLDGDGVQDVIAANGLPFVSTWIRLPGDGFDDRSLALDLGVPTLRPRPAPPWGIGDPDLDRDGDGDLVVTIGDDNTNYALHAGSPIRNLLFRADGGAYEEVGQLAGLDAIGSWHTVIPFDLDGDDDADLGIGGFGSPPRVYRNDLPGGGALAITLRGTTSNHLGYGAEVDVTPTGLATRSVVLSRPAQLEGFAPPIVFAGTGAAAEAEVRVRWPSGTTQVVTLAPGTHTLVEPELFTVTPSSRRLTADGASVAVVRVTPRLPDGAIDTGATVTARLLGDGAIAAPVRDGDAWRVEVTAPAAPGRARVVIGVDGVDAGLRPALTWTAP